MINDTMLEKKKTKCVEKCGSDGIFFFQQELQKGVFCRGNEWKGNDLWHLRKQRHPEASPVWVLIAGPPFSPVCVSAPGTLPDAENS